jgi:ABC-type glycerol-3-phosphate transport system permease component
MQQAKSPWIRGFIHLGLIFWVIYSVLPFVMSIITSLQITRDATARVPRYMPVALVENNLLIAAALALVILIAFITIRHGETHPTRLPHYVVLMVILFIVVGGFLLQTSTVPENQTFHTTWANYQVLWLDAEPESFMPLILAIAGMAVLMIGVVVWATRTGIASSTVYFGLAAVTITTIIFLPNFVRFASFYSYFVNSLIVTVGTVLISISIGCLAGYGLARYSGYAGVVLLFILPYYYFAQLSGLYDTYILLIITFVAINQPFTIWMLRSFFMEIPREIEEAAMIDGCTRLTAFFRVIIPITWPGIITTALFTLLLAYNEFLLARLLTSTLWTLPVGISRFTSGEDVRLLPLSNASAVSITIPIIFIIIFFQRHLIKGLAGGAVKG